MQHFQASDANAVPALNKCSRDNIWAILHRWKLTGASVTSSAHAQNIEETINSMAFGIHELMKVNGFWDNQLPVGREGDTARIDQQITDELIRELTPTIGIAKIGLVNTELAEWVEALRKPETPSEHCPEINAEEEEAADAIVRILDLAEARGLNVGRALVYKMLFNGQRPYKHGKLA